MDGRAPLSTFLELELWEWQEEPFKLDYHTFSNGVSASIWDEFSQEEELAMAIFPAGPMNEPIALNSRPHSPTLDSLSVNNSTHEVVEEMEISSNKKRRRTLQFCNTDEDAFILGSNKEYSSTTTSSDTTTTTTTTTTTNNNTTNTATSVNTLSNASQIFPCTLDEILMTDIGSANSCETSSYEAETQMRLHADQFLEKEEWKLWTMAWEEQPDEISQTCSMQEHPSKTLISGKSNNNVSKRGNRKDINTTTTKTTSSDDQSSHPLLDCNNKRLTNTMTPIAYPFSVPKPSKAEGHITLKDINQRIQMGNSTKNYSNTLTGNKQATCKPLRKSILGLTRIHTQGNGCITIIRTKKK